ncbi:nuclear transport factor 2 family protein [Galbibacter sp. EGI 63066]|uniref:nuclear transport factor 2 family protein n=1 Tax=Galbibacter sp. EGI 63066 TaxID=2993559 RepID=UPI002248C35C|nr:nuclear transport factor 2 family protein [Galbibacter sp. EGI 63066]MCX2681320.1 nuclear transport factor 2 family protein [Galbibacter sp. EGI 63066]
MSKTALETVQAFQMSMGSGTNDWVEMVSENVTFKGPVADVKGKSDFIELNKGFFPMVRGYEPLNSFGNATYASLEGTFKLATPKGNEIELEMAEVYTVEDGKIQSVRVYYDAEEYRKEFGN